jgi:hypothetical protein
MLGSIYKLSFFFFFSFFFFPFFSFFENKNRSGGTIFAGRAGMRI